jgi:membrane protein YfhO
LPEHPSLAPVWVGKDFEGNARAIYQNTNAFPRAWVVGNYQVITGEAALIALAEGRVDLRATVVLAEEPSIKPAPGDSAQVAIERWQQKEMVMSVELDRPGILVVSEAYYPDWKATVDGAPAPVLRANYAFRAVALAAGRHQIVMRYDDSLLRKGASISAGSLGVTILTLIGSWLWQARRRKELWWKRSS